MMWIWLFIIFNPITLLAVYVVYSWSYVRQYDSASQRYFYYFVTAIGAPIDVVVNATWAWLFFWQIPRTWMLTERVKDNKYRNDWRGKLAKLLCSLLNHFLPGHCH